MKGYDAMRTSDSVAALKNVDFPHDGFPIRPSNIVRERSCALRF